MPLGRYLLGVLLGGVALVPVHAASYLWRARLVEQWRGARARLLEFVVDLAVIVCVSELLGSVHLYRIGPMVAVLAVVGVGGCMATRWLAPANSADHEPGVSESAPVPSPPGALLAALIAVALVMADWSTRTVAAYHHGMLGADTIWYHMPFAARFVQDGSVTALHYVDNQPVTVFFPANSELVHSLGILFMGNDLLSPVLNTLWLGLALLAAWCIGRAFGVAPVTLTGAAVLFATPGLVATQPGGAYDDIVGLALVLASVALLVNRNGLSERARKAVWGAAALPAGLALGTKFTFIAPVVALTVGIWFLATRGKRVRLSALWLALVLLTGIFWYGRNLAAVGNPLPSLHLKFGPIALPSPPVGAPTLTVAHFLFNGHDWSAYFLPGLRLSFGPAWWGLLGLAVIGSVLAAVAGDRQQRVLGLVALASGVIFLFTPQYLTIYGVPVFFVDNVRYADPAVILGLVLLPISPMLVSWRRARWLLGAYTVIIVVTQSDAAIWPSTLFRDRFVAPVGGSDSVAGALVGVAVFAVGFAVLARRRRIPDWHVPTVVSIALAALVVVGGYPLQQAYLRDRYVGGGGFGSVSAWAQHESHLRIAVIGQYADLQYPLYGKTLTNYVQYLGVRGPHGAYSPFTACASWREALNQGHYSYALVTTSIAATKAAVYAGPPSETTWTSTDAAARVVFHGIVHVGAPIPGYLGYTLYHFAGRLDPAGCGRLDQT